MEDIDKGAQHVKTWAEEERKHARLMADSALALVRRDLERVARTKASPGWDAITQEAVSGILDHFTYEMQAIIAAGHRAAVRTAVVPFLVDNQAGPWYALARAVWTRCRRAGLSRREMEMACRQFARRLAMEELEKMLSAISVRGVVVLTGKWGPK